ncbi:hypothetical protein [Cohnella zeiphila]|uniref:Lipoprotein n=1 Tax=Cohnella zeiphila TaxID=2761120 RepID=A0A7X0STA6_9BACL|nr:hypothetical protein [Cohnella zeiphila]MBB6735703.1 hypothetical protein [Cohnella zeiphila]
MKPLLAVLAPIILLLVGCGANDSPNGSPSPAGTLSAVFRVSAMPAASEPGQDPNPLRSLQPEQIASVEVSHVPLGDERLEPLVPSHDGDKAVIARLTQWLRDAEPAAPDLSVLDEARSQTWAVLNRTDAEPITVNQLCSYKDNGATVDCHESEGWVSVTVGAEGEPAYMKSADMAEWLGGLYGADVTAVISSAKPRAIGRTKDGGRLQLMPIGEERYRKLGAASCQGGEDDDRLTGRYEMQYASPDGTVRTAESFPSLTLVQPNLNPVTLESLDFGTFAAFLFAPEYTGCHGIEFRLYGVQGGQAFPFMFRLDDGTSSATWSATHAPGTSKPKVTDGNLVVETGPAAGMDEPVRYTFRPDLRKREMKLIKQEEIRSSDG